MFVVVLAALLAAVGQVGRINGRTLVVVLVLAVVAGVVIALRVRRREC